MKKGWEIKRLGDLCDFGNGLWAGKKPPFVEVGVIRNTNFSKEGTLDDQDIVRLQVEQSQYLKRKLQYGDIIIEKSGGGPKQPVGRVIVFDKHEGEFSFSNFTSIIRTKNKQQLNFEFLHKYLFFIYCSGVTEKMQNHSTGIRNLNFDAYKQIAVPIPSLFEQQRIVAILNEASAAIARAKENAEKNLLNSREIFESYLQGMFLISGEKWEEKPLAQLCDSKRIITYGVIKLGEDDPGGVPCLRTSNVRWLFIETEGMKRIAPELSSQYSRTILNGGEVLVNVRGTLGGVAVASKEMAGWNVSREVAVIPVDPSLVNPTFLSYLIGSSASQQWLGYVKKGAAYIGINIEDLRLFPVRMPNLDSQNKIVQHLKILHEETKKLEAIYQQKLVDLEELKIALLEKAFKGELTGGEA